MKIEINIRVITPQGPGEITGFDKSTDPSLRYEVTLDNKPKYYNSNILYYFENEVEVEK